MDDQRKKISMVIRTGRANNQLRPIRITYNKFGYAPGSVLFEIGNTKVLCAVTISIGVPPFLKGTKRGWLNAEYAMLPTATVQRTLRESVTQKRCGRATEISRLIGRALRSIVKLDVIGERTITIDCDILQADGGTRTAAISGACLALKEAERCWLRDRIINQPFVQGAVAAISVGMVQGVALLDLDSQEDMAADADFNFILAQTGSIVEMQGSVENGGAISWENFNALRNLAVGGINELFALFSGSENNQRGDDNHERVPFFSLKNRFNQIP